MSQGRSDMSGTEKRMMKWLKMRLGAGYTVEAAYVMSITFFALATVFGAAFRLKEEVTGRMRLHEQVELLRYREDPAVTAIVRSAGGNGWSLEIRAEVFDQEAWLRKISLAEEYLEDITENQN